MKRLFAILLTLALIFSLAACGTETVIIDNTGSSDTQSTESEKPSDEGDKAPSSSQKEETEKPSSSSSKKPASDDKDQPHTHNYIPKTTQGSCIKKGSTTFTCSCGDSYTEETDFAHTYEGYFCSKCLSIHPDHVGDYLKEVIETNGNSTGAGNEYVLNLTTLVCDYTNNIIVRKSGYEDGTKFDYSIDFSRGKYSIEYGSKKENGNFDAAKLTKTTKICKDAELDNFFHTLLAMMVSDFSDADIRVTLADLGFKNYK